MDRSRHGELDHRGWDLCTWVSVGTQNWSTRTETGRLQNLASWREKVNKPQIGRASCRERVS